MRDGAGEPRGSNTAGALAAAVAELRPVEIVGLYEGQREGLEVRTPFASKRGIKPEIASPLTQLLLPAFRSEQRSCPAWALKLDMRCTPSHGMTVSSMSTV